MPGNSRIESPSASWTGQTLFGKWTVERLIGVGGTSTVLQARHRNGRRAALKILHPHLAAQGRARERFLREGRLANLVSHPGVVAVLDDFTADDGTAVLVLELVKGKTLSTLAKESGGVLTQHAVVSAAREVLDILAVAHEANVIHRDIKPENILQCESGGYKLADFGLAGLCHELGMLTGTNQSLGTPAYMSPEQARGDAVHIDARTDIWGLGATMFTLLTGRYVHANATQKNLIVAAATEPPPPIRSVDPAIDPALADLVDRAVRMDREERWPNALAMLAELRTIDVPVSDIRPLHAPSVGGGATMSTTPLSQISWSHAKTRLSQAAPPWLLAVVVLAVVTIALVSVPIAWRELREASETARPSQGEHQPAALAQPENTINHLPPPDVRNAPANPPREVRGEPSLNPERTTAPPSTTPPSKKSTVVQTLPTATARPTSTPTEPAFTIPDELLDRRE